MRAAFQVQAPTNAALRALNYSPYIEAFRTPRVARQSFALRDILKSNGIAYGYSFPRRDCEPKYGIELLSQSDMFSAEPAGRWIRAEANTRAERHRTNKWDILTAGVGTLGDTELYGRSVIVDSRLEGRYVGDSMLLRCANPGGIDNLYLYAFLCTAVGVSILRSTSYGTKQLRFRLSLLSEIRVPDPEPAVKKTIADLIRTVVDQRGAYLRELRAARNVIESLPEMQLALEQCGERKRRAVVWSGHLPTLGARASSFSGEALIGLATRWKQRIEDVIVPGSLFVGKRFARVSCSRPYGIDLVSQRDVFMIRRFPRRVLHPGLPDSLLFSKSDTLLIACDGQFSEGSLFGGVEIAAAGLTRCGITQHIMRMTPREEHVGTAYAFLTTKVGRRFLQSAAVGTSVPSMRLDLVAALPFPVLDSASSKRIQKHVDAAISARQLADNAEAEAIRIIEQEVLPSWLS